MVGSRKTQQRFDRHKSFFQEAITQARASCMLFYLPPDENSKFCGEKNIFLYFLMLTIETNGDLYKYACILINI